MKIHHFIKHVTILGFPMLIFVSCTKVLVVPPLRSEKIAQLESYARKQITVKISQQSELDYVGNQYLFLAIPVTAIDATSTLQDLKSALRLSAAKNDLRIIFVDDEIAKGRKCHYQFKIKRVSLNAYDLLFVRYIRGFLEVDIQREDEKGFTSITGEASLYKPFAFNKELSQALWVSYQDIAKKIVKLIKLNG
jgi:hypothetical protein